MTKTKSLRLDAQQLEEIEAAAFAANLPVATYLYNRVTDTPILTSPALAALAQLISTLHELKSVGCADVPLLEELRAMVLQLSGRPESCE